MECQLVVKDFKKIKSAKVTVKGFTVLSAANAHGKSTLFDSVVKTLDNDFSDEYYRHGTESYLIGIKLKDEEQEYSLVVKRDHGTNYLSYNGGEFHSKLGRSGLNQVCPEFPLKRVDYEAVKIYPNFALQGKIPMFEDISPTELLSSLYSDVFRISKKATDSKKNIAIRTEEVKKVNSQILYVREQANQVKSDYSKLDREKVLSDHSSLLAFESLQSDVLFLEEQIQELGLTQEDIEKYSKYESLVDSALEFKPQYDQYLQMVPIADKLNSDKGLLSQVQSECEKYQDIQPVYLDLLQKASVLAKNRERLDQLESELKPLDKIDSSLLQPLQAYVALPKKKQQLDDVEVMINQSEQEIQSINGQLSNMPCPTLLNLGYCPYSK